MQRRGVPLLHSISEDPYIKGLIKRMHSGIKERFLDRLLIGSVFESKFLDCRLD